MNYIAIYPSHDASISVYINNIVRIFEIERITKKRFASLLQDENWKSIYDFINLQLKKEFNNFKFDICYYLHLPEEHKQYLSEIFSINSFQESSHHKAHAACSFYQSPFNEALIISYDGGGLDPDTEERVSFFNIYHAKDEIKRIATFPWDLGTSYGLMAVPISEIKKSNLDNFLSFAGKKMGLVAYGNINYNWVPAIEKFYKQHKHCNLQDFEKSLNEELFEIKINNLEGQQSYDLAATSQYVFEKIILETIKPYIDEYKLPICLSGGCALNVILNQKLYDLYGNNVFIPPNPSDCGLSYGMLALNHKIKQNIAFSGIDLLDRNNIIGNKCSMKDLAQLLANNKIIGFVNGRSEHGPRALGHRSILCNPNNDNMKDILNAKIKFREWFRPFAPIVKEEDVNKYFDFNGKAEFMSFSPQIKKYLPATTHKDNSARVQTINKDHILYDLLTEFEKLTGIGVLLNTSFNIKGKPIITSVNEAYEILSSTDIDGVWIENMFKAK